MLGEEDRRIWESQGISMYAELEKSFIEVGYNGSIDILTLPKERGIWIYAIANSIDILRVKFGSEPRR